MSQGSTTHRPVHLFVDDASEYLRTRNAQWLYDTAQHHGELLTIDLGADFCRTDVPDALKREGIRLGKKLSLATHEHLEAFASKAKNQDADTDEDQTEFWNQNNTIVEFGSYVEHPDLGQQVAILYGGKHSTMELVGADKHFANHVRVLCVAE